MTSIEPLYFLNGSLNYTNYSANSNVIVSDNFQTVNLSAFDIISSSASAASAIDVPSVSGINGGSILGGDTGTNSISGIHGGDTSFIANFSFVNDVDGSKRDFVFDRTDVRVIFITLYSLVFCCCFFGKCTINI